MCWEGGPGGPRWPRTLPVQPTLLWARSPEIAREISERHTNEKYLPGIELAPELEAFHELDRCLADAEAVLVGVPSHGARAVLAEAASHIAPGTPVFSLSKGIEDGTALRMSQVIAELVPQAVPGVVTGPNLAREIALGQPAACLVACEDELSAQRVQAALHTTSFRAYVSTDVIGCEIAGATKNVLAIAAGIADGFGFGENTCALLIARGLAEMGRLGIALGGHTLTFGGLAGARRPRRHLDQRQEQEPDGRPRSSARAGAWRRSSAPCTWSPRGSRPPARSGSVAEQADVEMPICDEIAAIVEGATTPSEALDSPDGPPREGEWDDPRLQEGSAQRSSLSLRVAKRCGPSSIASSKGSSWLPAQVDQPAPSAGQPCRRGRVARIEDPQLEAP